ncbi:glycosyltransferase [Pollutibacter soli]|uniref:glycosyltransferase n=1 Tax=Pollutibacter soli TaxID=3034157 RepID=UPI003013BE07
MKIAFISIVRDPWGGSEELWAKAAKLALDEKHEVFISFYKKNYLVPQLTALQNDGAQIIFRRGYIAYHTPLFNRVWKKAKNFLLNRIFNPYNSLFAKKPDLIVYSCSCYSILDDTELLKKLEKSQAKFIINTQVNVEYGKPINESQANIVREAFQRASRVLFVSERNLEVAERHLASKISNSGIVRNPVNLSDTSIVPFPDDTGRVEFAMVANLLVNHKGHDIIIEVLSKPKWKNRDWHLNIYGRGIDEGYIKALVQFFDLTERITFHGHSKDIRNVWKSNHLLLMPSLNEGMPLAVVEAMICGRIVIATDVGGHMEWISDGENGFIAEGANVYSFDRTMERAWQSSKYWKIIGERAHETATAKYDPFAERTFLNILEEHGRGS